MSNISINDTHRLPYIKGKFTATKLGPGLTTNVKFYDSDDNDLGYEIYTNSEGFICDANGNLLGNGVFVHLDAVVSGHYNGARFVQWAVKGVAADLQVNDGKLRNKLGDVVWSANSQRDYTLQWNDIAGTPAFNSWSENEQPVIIEKAAWDSVLVNPFTKIITIAYDSNAEVQASGISNLTLFPKPDEKPRYGQVIFVKVMDASKARALQLWNASNDIYTPAQKICTIAGTGSALIALLSDGTFVCLEQSGDANYNDIGVMTLNSTQATTFEPRYIDDSTPKVIQIHGAPTHIRYDSVELNLQRGSLTAPRRVILWWQPTPDNAKYQCLVQAFDNGVWNQVMWLRPYTPMEVIIYPTPTNGISIVPVNADVPTLPSIAEVRPTVGHSEIDGQSTRTIVSKDITLPTGVSRVSVAWNQSEFYDGGPKYILIAKFLVPWGWKGDVFITGAGNISPAASLGAVVELRAVFATPDGTPLHWYGSAITDIGQALGFADNSGGDWARGCAKFFIEANVPGGGIGGGVFARAR